MKKLISSVVAIALLIAFMIKGGMAQTQSKSHELPKQSKYSVVSPTIKIELNKIGEITGRFDGLTHLKGCIPKGAVMVKKLPGGGYSFTRNLADEKNQQCTLTEKFTPTNNSISREIW
jgi:hypothetical protein